MIFKKPDRDVMELKWKVYGSHFYFIFIVDLLSLFYFVAALIGAISFGISGIPAMASGAAIFMIVGFMLLVMSSFRVTTMQNSYLIKKAEGVS